MEFLVTGYLLTWVVLVGYAWRLERRARSSARALEGLEPARRREVRGERGAEA